MRAVIAEPVTRYFVTAALFSLAINVLYLATPLYMLSRFTTALSPARAMFALVMITVVLLAALAALAGLDLVRARVLSRASIRLDRLLAGRVVAATFENVTRSGQSRTSPLRDFDTFRQYITGSGIHAMFDLPWSPIYIGVIFLLHPLLGAFAFASAITLVTMALINELLVREPLTEANDAATRNYNFTERSLRNAEVVQAMGMVRVFCSVGRATASASSIVR